MGEEKLDDTAAPRLASLVELGDPEGEVAISYRVKERLRDFYATRDPDEARAMLRVLLEHCLARAMPPKIQKLGKTVEARLDKICNFHVALPSI
jgi:hypothetical protein